MLYHEQGNKSRVVGYDCGTLTPIERNCHLNPGKLKFLALKWAITHKFRDYLFYSPFFITFTVNNLARPILMQTLCPEFHWTWTNIRDCTEKVPKDVLLATLDAAREQAKGTIPWVTAIATDLKTPEPTLKDLNLTPFSPKENQGGTGVR